MTAMSSWKNIWKLSLSIKFAPTNILISRQISGCIHSTYRNRHVVVWQKQRLDFRCSCPIYSNIHTNAETADRDSMFTRFKKRLGFGQNLKFNKKHLNLSGVKLYALYSRQINATEIMTELKLPDTFNSWFLVTELHIWLLMTKLSTLGEEGRYIRNGLVQSLWTDVDAKSKTIKGFGLSSKRQEAMKHFHSHFIDAVISYDEGLLSDDRVLAAAVWRLLFERKEVDAEKLARVVEYIRKQVKHFEEQDSDVIHANGILQLLPFFEDREPYDFTNKFANQPSS